MASLLGKELRGFLVKYWILFCCSMFFVVSFSGKVMVYKILYIVLFLFCIILYQVVKSSVFVCVWVCLSLPFI